MNSYSPLRYAKAYGRKGCFARGTLVSTPEGEVEIQTLRPGDEVFGYDDKGNLQVCKVTETYQHCDIEVWEYSFWGGIKLEATPNHFILNAFNAFAAIGSLEEGDCVVNYNNHLLHLISKKQCHNQMVYNLDVLPTHTFIANGLRVHNGGIGQDLRSLEGRKKKKKKKGGSTSAKEAPNTLQSRSTARVIDVLSEGEIKGLTNGERSIFFDETPYQSDDSSYNFDGIDWDIRFGTPDQVYMAGFPEIESEVGVGVAVVSDTPIVRTVSNPLLDAIRVTIKLDSLFNQNTSTGDLNPYEARIRIELKPDGGSYTTVIDDVIAGKTTAPWNKSYRFEVSGSGPWDVRLSKLTEDTDSSAVQDDVTWESYTEILDYKLTYPDTAYVGLAVNAEQFEGRVPSRAYEIDGLICRVPTNYDPDTKLYTGLWDGTWKRSWTDNNAWIMYEILTNTRFWNDRSELYGSVIDEEQVDKWSFYEAAQYCDGLVPDGNGGLESRFTFNASFMEREEAFTVIQALASSFHAMVYWVGGQMFVSVDKPSEPVKLISPANVIDGTITYQGTALRSRHTAAIVSYNDPSDGYLGAIELYEDAERVRKYGWNPHDVVAFGCTRRSQAYREGFWVIDTEWSATQTATFQVTFDNADLLPGEVVKIADPRFSGIRMSGRIVSATTISVTLDTEFDFLSGETYTLDIMMPDQRIETRTVTNSPGKSTLVTWSDSIPLNEAPPAFHMFMLTATNVAPRQFKILQIQQKEINIFEITSLLHDPNKYERIELGINRPPTSYSTLPTGPILPPTNLSYQERLYLEGAYAKSAVTLSWSPSQDPRTLYYEVSVKAPGSTWYPIEDTSQTSCEIVDTQYGQYGFRVRAVTGISQNSSWLTAEPVQIMSVLAPPSDVENFKINVVGNTTYLSWNPVTDLDLRNFELKFSPVLENGTWESSTVLIEQISKNLTSITVPTMVGTYLLKAVDYSEVYSTNAAIISTNVRAINDMNVVVLFQEDPDWTGTRTDVLISDTNELYLDSDSDVSTWDDISEVDNWVTYEGETINIGIYELAGHVDLGDIFTSTVTPTVLAYGEDLAASAVASWTDISAISDWASSASSNFGVIVEIATSDNAHPTGYGPWTELIIGDYTCRSMKFRAILFSLSADITPKVQSLSISVDMPDRVAGEEDILSDVSGTTITYDIPFMANPAIGISWQEGVQGDYYVKNNESPSGFDIQFFNASDIAVVRSFDWVAKGYGYNYTL